MWRRFRRALSGLDAKRVVTIPAAITTILVSGAVLPRAAAATSELPGPKMIAGIGTHLAQNATLLAEQIGMLHQAGAMSLRDEIYWDQLESTKGMLRMPSEYDAYVDTAVRAGIR